MSGGVFPGVLALSGGDQGAGAFEAAREDGEDGGGAGAGTGRRGAKGDIFHSLPEFMDLSHFLGLDHFSGKQKVWTSFVPSTQQVS